MKIIMRIPLTELSRSPKADACLRAKRRCDCNAEASMFSGNLIGWWSPVLRLVTLAVCLDVVIQVTTDFHFGTWANWAKSNQRTSARKVGFNARTRSSLFQSIMN